MAKRVLKDYENVSLKEEDLGGRCDFESIFGRAGAVHIEIGSGKGTFLLNQARYAPEVNFLGIEWANKYYRHTVDRIGRWGLENVRIIRTDAAAFLAEYLPDASVQCFHIYFPDPWPKKRHHKRRFFCRANMAQMLRCLQPGGIINTATDHSGYFEQIKAVIAAEKAAHRVEIMDFIPAAGALGGEITGTNYERKYIRDKRTIHAIAAVKI